MAGAASGALLMERALILALTVTAVLVGTSAAVIRPGVYRLGDEGTPRPGTGVAFRGGYRQGRWRSDGYRRDWGGFQGRGLSGAK